VNSPGPPTGTNAWLQAGNLGYCAKAAKAVPILTGGANSSSGPPLPFQYGRAKLYDRSP